MAEVMSVEAAARRVCEEVIRLVLCPLHEGTRCVLVPEHLIAQLEAALIRRREGVTLVRRER